MIERKLYTIMLETSDDGKTWSLDDDAIDQAESCDPAALAAAVMNAEVEGMPEGHGWLRVGVWEPDLPGNIGLAEAVVVRKPSGGGGATGKKPYTYALETSDDGRAWSMRGGAIAQTEADDPAALAAAVLAAEAGGPGRERRGWLRVAVWSGLPGDIGSAEAVIVRGPTGDGGHGRA